MIQFPVYQRSSNDCFRCCVATMLGWGYESVPDFMEATSGVGAMGERARTRMDKWFAQHDLALLRFPVPVDDPQTALNIVSESQPPGVYYIVTGTTIKGLGHAWVAQSNRILHDPANPSQTLIGPHENGVFWTYFLGLK